MQKLYQKNELGFALAWIGIYVVGLSAADAVSISIGLAKVISLPALLGIAAVLVVWIRRGGLLQKYGLCRPRGNGRSYLYYLPLLALVSANLWHGTQMNMPALECLLYVLSMLLVGVVEEIIFRGLLFKALCRDGLRMAILISSVSFGLGHIVNLLNGAPVGATLMQLVYASAIGFTFTMLFHRSGSLIPCIVVHGIFNALSAFAVERSMPQQIATMAIITILSIAYGFYLLKQKPQ